MSAPGGAPHPSAATPTAPPSSASPAPPAPPPPAPLVALDGSSVVHDAFANTINSLASSFQTAMDPNKSVLSRVNGAVSGALGLMNAPAALLDTGIAMWSEPVEDLLFAGGPHQAVNGDFEAFCAAFG